MYSEEELKEKAAELELCGRFLSSIQSFHHDTYVNGIIQGMFFALKGAINPEMSDMISLISARCKNWEEDKSALLSEVDDAIESLMNYHSGNFIKMFATLEQNFNNQNS